MALSSEKEEAPEERAEEEPAQARELALGLSIVRELHTSRVSALDGESERKLRWDLVLMGALSFEVRSRMTGSFKDGKSIALGKHKQSMMDCDPKLRDRITRIVRLVLDEVFWLAKAGPTDQDGVRQLVAEAFLPDSEDVQRDRRIVLHLVRAYQESKMVAKSKQLGPTLGDSRQILSTVAHAVPSRLLEEVFGATPYEIKQARLHAADFGPGARADVEILSRMCRSFESVETFNAFIEMYTSALDASEKNATQGLVHVLTLELAELYKLYEKHCASRDPPEEAFCEGVFRDLASRKNGYQNARVETCVCSWCKDGREAFERLLKLLGLLPAPTDEIKARINILKKRVAALYRRYKGGVFANECLRGAVEPGAPKIASHCRTWLLAVSDEIDGDRPFYQKCEHNGLHDERCAQCDEFLVIQVDTRAIIMDLAVPDERAKMLDVAARCFGSEAGILRYIAHIVRDFHQGRYRDEVMAQLLWNQILVWCDYAMKWLPMKKLQTISDRMGLSGVSVHNFVVIMKLENGFFKYLNFRVACNDAKQDFVHTLGGFQLVLTEVKREYNHMDEAFVGMDNAVNYSGIGFATGLIMMGKVTGIRVLATVTNEPGMGKDICNAMWSFAARALRSYVAHKGDVETAADIVRALDDTESLRGGNFVMRMTRDAKQAKPASVPLKSMCRHVQYPAKGGLILRLALNIGPGLFIPQVELNRLYDQCAKDSLQVLSLNGVEIVGPQLRVEIQPRDVDADATPDDAAVSSVPVTVLMPGGKVKPDRKAIREAKRQRRKEREERREKRLEASAKKDMDLVKSLEDKGFGHRRIYRCTKCRFRCFSVAALDLHVCNLLGQRIIKGRTRNPRVETETVDAAGAWAGDAAGAGAGDAVGAGDDAGASVGTLSSVQQFASSSGGAHTEDGKDGDDFHPDDLRVSSSDSEQLSDESGGHSDDCALDVVVFVLESDSEADDSIGGAESSEAGAKSSSSESPEDAKEVLASSTSESAAKASADVDVWCPTFGLEGSCRYPPPKKGCKIPEDIVAHLRNLFPLKLKGPQVLELLQSTVSAEKLEESDITARRIKNWQGAELQRRLQSAKKTALTAPASASASASASSAIVSASSASVTDSVSAVLSSSAYVAMTVPMLKETLKNRRLKVGGNKADLIQRLETDDLACRMDQILRVDDQVQ